MKRPVVIGIVVVVVLGAIAVLALPITNKLTYTTSETAYSKTFQYQDKTAGACVTVVAEGSMVAHLTSSKAIIGYTLNRVTSVGVFDVHSSFLLRNLRGSVCTGPTLSLKQSRFAQTASNYPCSSPQEGPLTSNTSCSGYQYSAGPDEANQKFAGIQFSGPGKHDAYASSNNYVLNQSGSGVNSWPKTCVDVGAWAQYQTQKGGSAVESGYTWDAKSGGQQQVCITMPARTN